MSTNKGNFPAHVQNTSNAYNKNFSRSGHANANQQFANQMNSRQMPMHMASAVAAQQQHQGQQQAAAAAVAAAAQYEMLNSFTNQMRQPPPQQQQPQQAPTNHHPNKGHGPAAANYMLNPHLAAAAAAHQAHNYQPFYSPMPTNYAMTFPQMFQIPGAMAPAAAHHGLQPPLVPIQSLDAMQHAQMQQQQQHQAPNAVTVAQQQPQQTMAPQTSIAAQQLPHAVAASAATTAKKKSNPIRIRAPDQDENMVFNEWFQKNSTNMNHESAIRKDFNMKVHQMAAEDGPVSAAAAALANDVAADKITPTVSANSDGAEITITNKSSKRDQPESGAASAAQTLSHKKPSKGIVITSATDSSVVSVASLAAAAAASEAASQPGPSRIIVVSPEAAESSAPAPHSVSSSSSSSNSAAAHNHIASADQKSKVAVTNALSTGAVVEAVAAVTSGVRTSKPVPSTSSAPVTLPSQVPQTMPTVAVVENVPEKALSKTGRERDLNMRGDLLLKQGSDFDAFSVSERPVPVQVAPPKEKLVKTAAAAPVVVVAPAVPASAPVPAKKFEKRARDAQPTFVAAANKIAPLPDIAKPKSQQTVAAGPAKSKSKMPAPAPAAAAAAEPKKSTKSTAAPSSSSTNQKPKAPSPTLLPAAVVATATATATATESAVTKEGKHSGPKQQTQQQKVAAKKETVATKPAAAASSAKVDGPVPPVLAQHPPQPALHKKTLTDMSSGAFLKTKFDVTNIVSEIETSSGAAGQKPVIPLYMKSVPKQSASEPTAPAVTAASSDATIDSKSSEASAAPGPSSGAKIEYPIAFENPANGTVIVFVSATVFRKYSYTDINTPMGNTLLPKRYTIDFAFEVTADRRCDWVPNYTFKTVCDVLRRASKTRPLPTVRVTHYQFSGSRGSAGNSRQIGGGNKGGYNMSGRNSMQGMASVGGYQPKISLKLDLDEDVKLNTAENAWKPSVLKHKKAASASASTPGTDAAAAAAGAGAEETSAEAKLSEKQELICKQIRSILNKLTAQNFDKLTKEALNCDISNEEILIKTVCNLIYDKAITETCFAESYANFCLQLSQSKIGESASASQKMSIFRKSLVARCQVEFERKETVYDKLKVIEACTNATEKRKMQLDFEEEERKVRRRTNGNIRFLGELYKASLLNCNVMMTCIKAKLNDAKDHTIESLCKLMTVVGEKLENEAHPNEVQEFFNKINRLIKNSKTLGIGQRVKFMMQDLVDLRNNKWKYVKAPKQNPMPYSSSSSSMIGLSSHGSQSMGGGGGGSGVGGGNNQYGNSKRMTKQSSSLSGNMGSISSGGSNSLNSNSSWQTVTSSAVSKSKSSNLSSVRNQNLDTMKLGPGDFNWSTGSKINDKPSSAAAAPTITGRSSLSAAVPSTTISSFTSQSTTSQPPKTLQSSSSNPNSYRPPPRLQSSSIENKSRHSSKNLPAAPASAPVAPTARRTPTPPKPVQTPAAAAVAAAPPKINFDNTIKEMFAHCSGGLELSKDPMFRETIEKATAAVFVEKFMMFMFEKTKVDFELASRMLDEMLRKKWLTKADVLGCLHNAIIPIFAMLLDDAPLASEYLMRLLAQPVFSQTLTLQDLKKTIFDEMKIEKECYKCFRALVAQFKKHGKGDLLRSIWNVQKYDVLDLIAKSYLAEFKETPEAKFFNECLSGPAESAASQNSADLLRGLTECLRSDSDPFDKTIEWIRTNMGVAADAASTNAADTVRALKLLVIAICRCSICEISHDAGFTVNKPLIKEQWKIVRKYFNSNYEEKSEVICLNAITEFMESVVHPKGVWHEISNFLYEDELISVNAFFAWKNESGQPPGRGVAMSSLGHFFQLLSSAQADKDDDFDEIVDKVKNAN